MSAYTLDLIKQRDRAIADRRAAEHRIAAVQALHQPVNDRTGWLGDGTYDAVAPACGTCGADDMAVPWPCPTIRALDDYQPTR